MTFPEYRGNINADHAPTVDPAAPKVTPKLRYETVEGRSGKYRAWVAYRGDGSVEHHSDLVFAGQRVGLDLLQEG